MSAPMNMGASHKQSLLDSLRAKSIF